MSIYAATNYDDYDGDAAQNASNFSPHFFFLFIAMFNNSILYSFILYFIYMLSEFYYSIDISVSIDLIIHYSYIKLLFQNF